MSANLDEPLDLTLTSTSDVQDAGTLLDHVVRAVRKEPTDELEVTLQLSELLASTVEMAWWDDVVYEAAFACAGIRAHGPLDLGDEFAWASAAAAVTDLVGRVEQFVGQHAPFGDALAAFNFEYERLTRHAAIRSGRTTEGDSGDNVPPEHRIQVFPLHPSRAAVLRSGWAGGRRELPEAPDGHPIWDEVDNLTRVWARGRRALGKILAFQRQHLVTFPLTRIRAELDWEVARVAHVAQEAQGIAQPGGRKPVRTDPPADEKQDARDKWLYEQALGCELTYIAIVRRLKRVAFENGWRVLGSIEGVRKAAQRYAEANHLPLPSARRQR